MKRSRFCDSVPFVFLIGAACGGKVDAAASTADDAGGSSSSDSGSPEEGVDPPENYATGSINGTTLAVSTSASLPLTFAEGGPETTILLSSVPSACPRVWLPTPVAGEVGISFTIYRAGHSSIDVGTLPIVSTEHLLDPSRRNVVTAQFMSTASDCSGFVVEATGGTMSITHIDVDGVRGTFDAQFATGSMHGAFNAPTCSSNGPVNLPMCTGN